MTVRADVSDGDIELCRVDHLLALADALTKRIDAASEHVERSSQAVLAKAFRGELSKNGLAGEAAEAPTAVAAAE